MTAQPLAPLLDAWETFADSLAGGYEFGLDDYLNDVDARQLIQRALRLAGEPIDEHVHKRLEQADGRFLAATEKTDVCLWGSRNAAENGWRAEEHWWYFALPKERGPEFDEDLEQVT